MRFAVYFEKHDAGAGIALRDKGDCTVRAFATARGLPYEAAWAALYAHQGAMKTCGFLLAEWLRADPQMFGVVRYLPFPAERGKPRMTGAEFCRTHPRGRYILKTAHHVAAVVDGKLYDTWNSGTGCVYNAWEIAGVSA